MKKYSTPAYVDGESGDTEFGSVDVYLASDVDARIADLELAAKENARYSTEMREEFKRRGERIAELEMQLAEAKGHIETLDRSNDRLRQKLEKLEAALAWALSEGATAQDYGEKIGFRDAGCSCCSGQIEPDEQWRDVVMKAARSALGKEVKP